MKKLNKLSKILNISHYDFDGASSAIVIANYFKNSTCKPATFSNVENILLNVKYPEYDKVILTDVFPNDPEILNISNKILVLDHHPQSSSLCNMENIIAFTDNCGAVLTKNWIEALFNVDLSHLNSLMKYTNDYDLWIHKYSKSKMVEALFWKYGFFKFKDRFINGNVRFTQNELNFLKEKRQSFEDTYKNLNVFELETINGCLVFVKEFINDIADRLLKKDGYEIAIIHNINNNHTSIRTKSDSVNIGEILKNLEIGGGHPKSGGLAKYCENTELKKDVEILENFLFENVEEWRK